MAFRKTLIKRLFTMPKISTPSLTDCRISSSSTFAQALMPSNPDELMAPEPGDKGISRRFLHKKAMFFNPATSPDLRRGLLVGDKFMEKLRGMGIVKDRIRLDGLNPPTATTILEPTEEGLSVEDARKLLRLAELEMVKSKLRQIEKNCISYSEFVQICSDGCLDSDQGLKFAKMLDESGTVIVLGNVVHLKPEQEDLKSVAKAIGGLLPLAPFVRSNDPRRKEFEEMEKKKAAIDKKADLLVRRELWCGLGYLVAQTAGFMRLTFWELSWDVMEPICFYVTSMYFMAGYTFFLRTSKEPSFEGFFQSRFGAKQKRIMKIENFDIKRYNELRRAFYPMEHHGSSTSQTPLFDNSESIQFGGMHH